MKTLKLFSAISLALVLFGVTSAYSNLADNRNNMSPITLIRYNVVIHLPGDLALCNMYMVQMVDAQGNFVSPTQTFIPGKSVYTFYERGPVTGVRIARLVMAPNMDHFVCPPDLFCNPAVKSGKFLIGKTYVFDLYPTPQPSR